jgi:probable rRNA maturation factor
VSEALPALTLINRQRRVAFDSRWLRRATKLALPKCAALSGDGRFALRLLPEVVVAVVSDATIARVHLDFMGIEGSTDVITFDHGEIVVSAETALCRSKEFTHTIEQELLLYCVHGLLHLNGYDDLAAAPAARMRRAQSRIHSEVIAILPSP